MWRKLAYHSYTPQVFVLHNALVNSSAGITAIGDQAIRETLSHTSPEIHAFRNLVEGVAIRPRQARRVAGTHISPLAGGERNYFHSLLLGLARLFALPDYSFTKSMSIPVPRGAARQQEVLALLDLVPRISVEEFSSGETLYVETFILPLSVGSESTYHPCFAHFFHTIASNVPLTNRTSPRRIYIDRSQSRLRPLVNERDLFAPLTAMGFAIVRPETMSVVEQVRLFRGADTIVAPHGAALTNLGFCRLGTRVIELLMDRYCNWCFSNLAGLMQLRYDCVLGRARESWWEISINHVIAAVAQNAKSAA